MISYNIIIIVKFYGHRDAQVYLKLYIVQTHI